MNSDLSLFRGASGVERAKEIIERMRAHDIPPTPANYEIWSAHVAGLLPDLSREIEARLASGQPFTDDINADLFERFFAKTRIAVQVLDTSKTIARELNESVSGLRDGGVQAQSYAALLQAAADRFGGDELAHLKIATQGMAEHTLHLADQLEISSRKIETMRLALEAIRAESLTDGLTGLANRKMFDEVLELRLRDAADAGSDLCLAVIDIDHFGLLNDNWGRTLGDQVLRYVGAVLQAHAQGDVLTARYGSDEFALIMPRTNLSLAEGLAARINRAVKAKRLSLKSTGDRIAEITVSIGVAGFVSPEGAREIFGRANACLLAAKAAGRDRVITDALLRRQSAA
jgi:diguanylate cyclase